MYPLLTFLLADGACPSWQTRPAHHTGIAIKKVSAIDEQQYPEFIITPALSFATAINTPDKERNCAGWMKVRLFNRGDEYTCI
ncbi:hypothetical protein [Dickeya solani]|uniref:Uncharacterized protein n=1 Tax=Dickeya solani TaxID=1089444 RepID=A0AAX4EWW5_9GAMM|nr:hypothetical protein [Dickeya solani]AUC40772.1 hypothetical protein D083_0422 [Dickeya solani RNS 08.23.3.1.A]AUH07131.1 hypothetical protein BJD21_00870 [Dickeya solani D s0432-1]ANE77459.1 hypothetical protein A4U42_20175 [Dickeya solani IPO 2222]AUH11180.1 hypothetical protein BJJ98_00830 [Dickeya solani]MBJ2340942.1 hypothetical protein [Dickeya solani]